MSRLLQVRISVDGGVASVDEAPPGIDVIIYDYDNHPYNEETDDFDDLSIDTWNSHLYCPEDRTQMVIGGFDPESDVLMMICPKCGYDVAHGPLAEDDE
jgi:hypothetical protein